MAGMQVGARVGPGNQPVMPGNIQPNAMGGQNVMPGPNTMAANSMAAGGNINMAMGNKTTN